MWVCVCLYVYVLFMHLLMCVYVLYMCLFVFVCMCVCVCICICRHACTTAPTCVCWRPPFGYQSLLRTMFEQVFFVFSCISQASCFWSFWRFSISTARLTTGVLNLQDFMWSMGIHIQTPMLVWLANDLPSETPPKSFILNKVPE